MTTKINLLDALGIGWEGGVMARYHFQSGSFPEIKASIHMSGPVLDVPKWVEEALSNDQIKQVFVLYQGPAGEKVDVWSRITEKGKTDEQR